MYCFLFFFRCALYLVSIVYCCFFYRKCIFIHIIALLPLQPRTHIDDLIKLQMLNACANDENSIMEFILVVRTTHTTIQSV